jgi:hypothetical protein
VLDEPQGVGSTPLLGGMRMHDAVGIFGAGTAALAAVFWFWSSSIFIPDTPEMDISGPKSPSGYMKQQSRLGAIAAVFAGLSALATAYTQIWPTTESAGKPDASICSAWPTSPDGKPPKYYSDSVRYVSYSSEVASGRAVNAQLLVSRCLLKFAYLFAKDDKNIDSIAYKSLHSCHSFSVLRDMEQTGKFQDQMSALDWRTVDPRKVSLLSQLIKDTERGATDNDRQLALESAGRGLAGHCWSLDLPKIESR